MQNFLQYLQNRSEAIFQLMLSLIFIVAGGNHLFSTSAVSIRLQNSDPGAWLYMYFSPELLVLLAGIGLTYGSLAILLGFKTRWTALALCLIIIPITIVIQLQRLHTLGPFFKNVGLAGGLIHFIANGSTVIAIGNIRFQKVTLQPLIFICYEESTTTFPDYFSYHRNSHTSPVIGSRKIPPQQYRPINRIKAAHFLFVTLIT